MYLIKFGTNQFLKENDVKDDSPAQQKDEKTNSNLLSPCHLHIFPLHSSDVFQDESRNPPCEKPNNDHPDLSGGAGSRDLNILCFHIPLIIQTLFAIHAVVIIFIVGGNLCWVAFLNLIQQPFSAVRNSTPA